MGDTARNYKRGTRAALAVLSRGACYFPGCDRQIIVFDDLGEPYIDYQIAHIYDANVGNRYREEMTDDERRDFSNLILLCKPHHERVDKRHADDYSPETLIGWKSEHEAGGIAALNQVGTITEEDLGHRLEEVAAIEFSNSVINLGGVGGSAPGAGGGGGGVVGPGVGGDGGSGGQVNLEGAPGTAPGAGGGGGGAIGADAFGGEGGGGGEHVSGSIPVEPGELFRIHVGGGGDGSRIDEDTYIERVEADGSTTEFFRAKGGTTGRSGAELRDLRDGPSIRLSSAFLCDAAQIKHGVLNVWGGGWDNVEYIAFPSSFSCVVATVAEVLIPGPRDTVVSFELSDSESTVRAMDRVPVSYGAGPEPHRFSLTHAFNPVEVTKSGTWRIAVATAGQLLSTIDIRLALSGQPDEPEER